MLQCNTFKLTDSLYFHYIILYDYEILTCILIISFASINKCYDRYTNISFTKEKKILIKRKHRYKSISPARIQKRIVIHQAIRWWEMIIMIVRILVWMFDVTFFFCLFRGFYMEFIHWSVWNELCNSEGHGGIYMKFLNCVHVHNRF